MKLILHIGTHKTASTSLQHFFTLNRGVLCNSGIHYPSNSNSAYVSNFLATDIIFDRGSNVRAVLDKAMRNANKLNCHTVLISAKSFYAEIDMRLQCQMGLPRNKLEITHRHLTRYFKKHIPGGRWLLRPLQIALHQLRLKHQGW
jgi:hypothetical protein